MHMGNMAIVGSKCPSNYVHVIFNNGAHDSVGGQPTVGHEIDIVAIAHAMHYQDAVCVWTPEQLKEALSSRSADGLRLVEIRVKKGNRKDLGRPTTTPIQNKEALMSFLKQ
jgi:phosphonopyruvate decarboxylase